MIFLTSRVLRLNWLVLPCKIVNLRLYQVRLSCVRAKRALQVERQECLQMHVKHIFSHLEMPCSR